MKFLSPHLSKYTIKTPQSLTSILKFIVTSPEGVRYVLIEDGATSEVKIGNKTAYAKLLTVYFQVAQKQTDILGITKFFWNIRKNTLMPVKNKGTNGYILDDNWPVIN